MLAVHTAIDQRRVANFPCLLFSADGWLACALLAAHCPSHSSWAPHLLRMYAHTWFQCVCLICVRFTMIFPVSSRPWVLRDRTLGHATLARHWSFSVWFVVVYTHCLSCARRLEVLKAVTRRSRLRSRFCFARLWYFRCAWSLGVLIFGFSIVCYIGYGGSRFGLRPSRVGFGGKVW